MDNDSDSVRQNLPLLQLRIGMADFGAQLKTRKISYILLIWTLVLPYTVYATTPLWDLITIDNQGGAVHQRGKTWPALPFSIQLQEMRRDLGGCSAIGGPRGVYKVEAGKLWLLNLYSCRSDYIDVTDVYPDSNPPVLATWITGDLVAEVGPNECYSSRRGVFIRAATVLMELKQGIVLWMETMSNKGHPDCIP